MNTKEKSSNDSRIRALKIPKIKTEDGVISLRKKLSILSQI